MMTVDPVPTYQLPPNGIAIPRTIHVDNRKRLLDKLREQLKGNPVGSEDESIFVLLQGGTDYQHGGSDSDIVFRQESYFHWTFGGPEPDWFGAIQVSTGNSILFVPRMSEGALVVMGEVDSPEMVKTKYMVDDVAYTDEIAKVLNERGAKCLLTLYGLNTDSGFYTKEATFEGIGKFRVNNKILHPVISECRVIKSEAELEIVRYTNKMSSLAHRHLMRNVKPGMYQYQAESMFQHYCYTNGGMRHVSYTCIGASGCDCAVLHYGHAGAPNANPIRDGDLCLFDMGGEYYCYTSDITCTFPANGKFTEKQRVIYNAVLKSNRAVLEAVRPGAVWTALHELAERVILLELRANGLLRGDVDEMMQARLGFIFMPHGLGHLLGCDTHDVGGYNEGQPARSTKPGLNKLRTGRTLQRNMVLTVEPGCYFVKRLLDRAQASEEMAKFLVMDKIAQFMDLGGVRIEDDIVVTEDSYEMLTDVPRTVEEIEAWIAGSD